MLHLIGIYTEDDGSLVGLWCYGWVDRVSFACTARDRFGVHVEPDWCAYVRFKATRDPDGGSRINVAENGFPVTYVDLE